MPLLMCLLICLIFSKGSPTNLPIAVLDEDNSENMTYDILLSEYKK